MDLFDFFVIFDAKFKLSIMAISQNIISLTELALKDRVLTPVEKTTIINAAVAEGTSEEEVTQYINTALKHRLESHYSKDELKRCPSCGAQVPLIADKCLFCMQDLPVDAPKPPPYVKITSEEAAVINLENDFTAMQQRDIDKCPNCGADFPLISNVCPYCHHVLREQADSQTHINNLIHNINQSIQQLRNVPKPTFIEVVQFRIQLIMFVVAAVLLVEAVAQSSATLAGWSAMCLCVSIVALLVTKKENSPVANADNAYYNALYTQEMYSRTIDTLYGEDTEARNLLKSYDTEIATLKKSRDENRKKIAVTFLVIIAVAALLPLLKSGPVSKYEDNRQKYPSVYQDSEVRKVITPYSTPVHSSYSPYIAVKGGATACLEVIPDPEDIKLNDWHILDGTPLCKLRISGVKILSTGRQLPNYDTAKLSLLLYDKNGNPIETGLHATNLETIDFKIKCADNIYNLLSRGEGSYYAEFVSTDTTADFKAVTSVIDRAQFFEITYGN